MQLLRLRGDEGDAGHQVNRHPDGPKRVEGYAKLLRSDKEKGLPRVGVWARDSVRVDDEGVYMARVVRRLSAGASAESMAASFEYDETPFSQRERERIFSA